jgi:hypothetical protein
VIAPPEPQRPRGPRAGVRDADPRPARDPRRRDGRGDEQIAGCEVAAIVALIERERTRPLRTSRSSTTG